jgi:hypothetical protein
MKTMIPLLSFLPPYFQHDPLGLFLVLAGTSTVSAFLILRISRLWTSK